jgi:hypothetical protein
VNKSAAKLTPAQREALLSAAIKQRDSAKKRAGEYRSRKKNEGLVQLSFWVPKEIAEQTRGKFTSYIQKRITEIKEAKGGNQEPS